MKQRVLSTLLAGIHRTERIKGTQRTRLRFAHVIILWSIGLLLSCGTAAKEIM
jgi:hypothetical protein